MSYCFKPALLDITDHVWLLDFEIFIEELETNFGTFNPKGEAKAELKQLCMHQNHQATKYFIKFQHSIGKHTMVLRNVSKTIWFTMANPTPSLDYMVFHKQLTRTTGNAKPKFPEKPAILDP